MAIDSSLGQCRWPDPNIIYIKLKDSIIDLVYASGDFDYTRSRTLSSLSLVCRAFRHRVNHHRFKTLDICDIYDIQNTYELLLKDRGLWKDHRESLNAHVQRFEVKMTGTRKHFKRLSILKKDSAKLEFIFANVFRVAHFQDHAYHSLPLTFAWRVAKWRPQLAIELGLVWSDMSDALQTAFRKLLQHPSLQRLELSALHDVPRDLIRSAFVQELQLSEICFSRPESAVSREAILSPWHLQHVTSFQTDTDHSTPLLDYIGPGIFSGKSLPATIFPRLQKLVCCIFDEEQCRVTVALMQCTQNVTHLSLSILDPGKLPRLPYDDLVNLETLSLSFGGALRPLAPDYADRIRSILAPIKPTIPPVIKHLEIFFAIVVMNNHPMDNETIFKGHDFSLLDDFLAERSPRSLESIEIQLLVVIASSLEEYLDHEGDDAFAPEMLFPKLAQKKSPLLKMGILVNACPDIPEEYYSSDPLYGWNGVISSL
ncbi:hypothetical protein BDN70DRAFT_998084 [Pholiota conissans]|uniref:Uncharacterized protein n=1 Tax=Pholiota conissans TaxID=109636 RepID=A0A9P5YRK2_9AGAR|nr:hypothetical protein BDN70DRAFT_998084 [Pholiota conissans]